MPKPSDEAGQRSTVPPPCVESPSREANQRSTVPTPHLESPSREPGRRSSVPPPYVGSPSRGTSERPSAPPPYVEHMSRKAGQTSGVAPPLEGKAGEPWIGIDFGTSYVCVGVWQNNRVEIIANEEGNRTTPSYVAFTDTETLIGDAAKNQAAVNPANTVFGAMNLVGRQFDEPQVTADRKYWPFSVVEGSEGQPMVEVTIKGEKERFAVEEILSMVLSRVIGMAEAYLGKEVGVVPLLQSFETHADGRRYTIVLATFRIKPDLSDAVRCGNLLFLVDGYSRLHAPSAFPRVAR